jgi:hypothetical protein
MTLSRLTALALLLPAGIAQAQLPPSTDQVMTTYRKVFPPLDVLDCMPKDGEEVVVCARRRAPNLSPRLQQRVEPGEGGRPVGEPRDPSGTLGLGEGNRCFSNSNCAKPTKRVLLRSF